MSKSQTAVADMSVDELAVAARRIQTEIAEREAARAQEEAQAAAVRRQRVAARQQNLRGYLAELAADTPPAPEDADPDAEWVSVEEYRKVLFRRIYDADIARERATDLADADLDDADPAAVALGVRFVQTLGPDALRKNLILAGNVGVGKTSLALRLGRMAVEQGMLVRVVSHLRYVGMLQPGRQPEGRSYADVLALYRESTDLLILDDLGAEMDNGASDAVARETVQLFGDRLNSGKPTIITTNLRSSRIQEILGDRAWSRIGGSAIAHWIDGPDRRCPPTF